MDLDRRRRRASRSRTLPSSCTIPVVDELIPSSAADVSAGEGDGVASGCGAVGDVAPDPYEGAEDRMRVLSSCWDQLDVCRIARGA